MYWFIADETNVDPGQGDFFIYGGLALNEEQFSSLHDSVVDIRGEYGFNQEDSFKFHTRSRPSHMDVDKWTEAKAAVIDRALGIGVHLIIYVVLHDIAQSQDRNKMMQYALNSLIFHFDRVYLTEHDSRGVVCIDRVDDSFGYEYFKEKFAKGVVLPNGQAPPLNRVLHYSMSCDGASHISSVVDICIGGIRYCINAATGKGPDDVARKVFPSVSRMLWHQPTATGRQIGGYGFLQYPKTVKVEDYRKRYKDLTITLTDYSKL